MGLVPHAVPLLHMLRNLNLCGSWFGVIQPHFHAPWGFGALSWRHCKCTDSNAPLTVPPPSNIALLLYHLSTRALQDKHLANCCPAQ